ncbi:MAG: metallophosphoesterase, partial [Flavobacteriales bacterium]
MSTQLQFTSDLHLEFPANKEFLMRNPIKPVGEVLLLAGDVVPFAEMHKHQDFFSYVSDHFEKTYWVPGNHEYYRADINERSGVVHESIRENVWLVNNTVVNHGPVRMVCSTLWSQISPAHPWEIERNMSDFRLIRNGAHRFSADRCNELHAESLIFLKNVLAEPWQGHTVVCSHHC